MNEGSAAGVIESVRVACEDFISPVGVYACYQVEWTGSDGLWSAHSIPHSVIVKDGSRHVAITDRPSLKTRRTLAWVHLIADHDDVRATLSPAGSKQAFEIPIREGWRYHGQLADGGFVQRASR